MPIRILPKRILIADDEALARQRIARYVRQFEGEFLIEEADNGITTVELIASFQPEIIFLDIEMPGLNGLEVLQQFEERPFHVIFQTAYDQFAIRAFEEHACDYLLKPFTAERLHQALSRAIGRVVDKQRLRALEIQLSKYTGGSEYQQKVTVKQGNRLRIVSTSEILCFVSRDHYTCVYFGEQLEGICDLSLTGLAERLDPQEFQQLHRNSVVRISAIVSLSRSKSGETLVELSNGMKLPVSRNNYRDVKDLVKSGR